jgi:Asp/Glu/hydantoin racemase
MSVLMTRIAFIHTVAGLTEKFRALANASLAGLDVFHLLDESLLQDLIRQAPLPGIARRLVALIGLAVEGRAELIVFTCSSTSPLVDLARPLFAVPILKVDDPMAEKAVQLGARIGILCTTPSTVKPSSELVRYHAQALGREAAVEAVLVQHAFAALQKGDTDLHDALVQDAALDLAARSDVIVLAQASMAHLAQPLASRLSPPVLCSPPILIEVLQRRVNPNNPG